MKKIMFILLLIFSLSLRAFAYDVNVHEAVSGKAIDSSNMGPYLTENLGFTLNAIINGKKVRKWIELGSNWEDDPPRWLNHFYDPTTELGLNLVGISYGFSSLKWGRDSSDFSFSHARANYYLALTEPNSDMRSFRFATMFRALGQIIHLIEDKAVPAHVRNDAHNYSQKQLDMYEVFTREAEKSPLQYFLLKYDGYPVVDLTTFNNFDSFWKNTGKGLAEFTNKNFFSHDTNYDDPAYQNYHNPSPIGWWTTVEDVIDPFGFVQVEVMYLQGYATDNYRPEFSTPINRLSSFSYLDFEADRFLGTRVYSLNEKVHQEYADVLIPRAVGYSAGLLNYFFRGTLEISAPDRCLFGLIDGSIIPQEFRTIKAKVKNASYIKDQAGNIIGIEEINNGALQAVAKYKKRTDYEPDLSNDPPTADSIEPNFSYSVSQTLNLTPEDMSVLNSGSKEFTFDFTSSPIPAGITDLYLQVVFKGTLGNEVDNAVAVGMKDLGEPMHHNFWNATDLFFLDGVFRTASDITGNQSLLDRVDHNQDGTSEEPIYPHDIRTEIAFCPGVDQSANVIFDPFPYGRFGRIITIVDADVTSFPLTTHDVSVDPPQQESNNYLAPNVINQEKDGIFYNTPVYNVRGPVSHAGSVYIRYYPSSMKLILNPLLMPVSSNQTPVGATTINP